MYTETESPGELATGFGATTEIGYTKSAVTASEIPWATGCMRLGVTVYSIYPATGCTSSEETEFSTRPETGWRQIVS